MCIETQTALSRLEQKTKQLTEELKTAKSNSQQLHHTLEETERDKKVITAHKHTHLNIPDKSRIINILTSVHDLHSLKDVFICMFSGSF